MTKVRTRFSPSPTGFQHIGGLRTAFYAALVAKHHGGDFLLRIEDTDRERTVPGAVRFLLEELAWFGLLPDEGPSPEELAKIGEVWEGMPSLSGSVGPYIQSLRLPRYKEAAERLIASGHAYRCDCTSEMLERERLEQQARKELPGYSGYCRTRNVSADVPHVVRFKMPVKVSVVLEDAVKGRVAWDSVPMRDPVLLKSDGFPTYHLAVVVDDHEMGITHVMRGEEWLPSAPLHLMVYEALGWEPPKFAHLPVVMGPDGKKLSKRHGAVSSNVLREQGYLAEAVLNYVVLVGWSPGDGEEQEVFSREELIQRFTMERINNSNGVFDYSKLQWMNGVYIRNLSNEDFLNRVAPFMGDLQQHPRYSAFVKIAPLVKERVKVLTEVGPMVEFIFLDKFERDTSAFSAKGMTLELAQKILRDSLSKLKALPDFSHSKVDEVLRALAAELGLKVGNMLSVLRIAVMGKGVTPPLFESFEALGQDEVCRRIDETLQLVSAGG